MRAYTKIFFTSLFLFLLITDLTGQDEKLLTKPKFKIFAKDSTNFKRHLDFKIDRRNTFIRNKPINISGVNIGYIFHKNIRIGIGVYKISEHYFSKTKSQTSVNYANKLKLFYLTPNFTYTFLNNRWLELSLMPESGFGWVKYERTNEVTKKTNYNKEWFVPLQLGLGGLFKINRWLGVEGSIGYRYVILQSNNAVFKNIFNSWYYSYGVKIFIGNVIKDIKYCHKYHKQEKKLVNKIQINSR